MKTFREILMESGGVTVKQGKNKSGTLYLMVKLHNPQMFDKEEMVFKRITEDLPRFVVYKQSKNYKHGNIMSSLVFVTPKKMSGQEGQAYTREGIPKKEAQALFDKKLKGKTR